MRPSQRHWFKHLAHRSSLVWGLNTSSGQTGALARGSFAFDNLLLVLRATKGRGKSGLTTAPQTYCTLFSHRLQGRRSMSLIDHRVLLHGGTGKGYAVGGRTKQGPAEEGASWCNQEGDAQHRGGAGGPPRSTPCGPPRSSTTSGGWSASRTGCSKKDAWW